MSGWLKLHRKLLEWEWYEDTNTKSLFIHCLLKANVMDKKWRGMLIKKGSFHTSIQHLSNDLNISVKSIRLAIEKLERTGEIKTERASKGTTVTLCNYDSYQETEKQKGKQMDNIGANEGQTRGKQRATTKEVKNIRSKEVKNNIDERKLKFASTLKPFIGTYGKDMINSFYKYWTEPNKSKTKFRQELEKTWDVERRLETWSDRQFKYGQNKPTETKRKELEL